MRNQGNPKFDSEFTCSIDATDENEWNSIIAMFRDATVNQTWAYGRIRSKKTSHLVLRCKGEIVAMAQARLVIVPFLKAGIAYVGSGPLWRLRGKADDIDVLREIVRVLMEEYVVRRGLFLRISPNVFTNVPNHDAIRSVFEEEGFRRKDLDETTLFLGLDRTLEDLRKGFHLKWRKHLGRAEKNNMMVRQGTDDELFKSFRGVYEEMLARKRYATKINIDEYEVIQNILPEFLKPKILVCESDGRPVAGIVISTNGETPIPLLAATSNEGTKCYASYLVQWELIKLLRELGFRTYDLGGCNPRVNPNTYRFKAQMLGKRPELSSMIGIMEACDNPISLFVVKSGEFLKSVSGRIKRLHIWS